MDLVTAAIPVLGWFGYLGFFAVVVLIVHTREARHVR
jgi:hypothetical protein